MGVLETLLQDVIGTYLPFLDQRLLHVDLMRGVFGVSDLDMVHERPPLYFLGGLPLELTRVKVKRLEAQAPWGGRSEMRIECEGVEISLRERAWGTAMEGEMETARARMKRRGLAEGERAAANKWVHRMLPRFLDCVTVAVRDVRFLVELCSGVSFILNLEGVHTEKPATEYSTQLAKSFRAEKLSIWTQIEGEPEVAVLPAVSFELGLTYSNGLLCAHLSVSGDFLVGIDTILLEHMRSALFRSARWTRAIKLKRPCRPVAGHAKDWFEYILRCFSKFSRRLTLDVILGRFRAFRKYTDLHIRRLRSRHRLRDEDERAIEELERELHVDMILLLRAKARKAVEIDDALYFAGGGWLSWLVFGSERAFDREKITTAMENAVRALDSSNVVNLRNSINSLLREWSNESDNWSRARLSASLSKVVASVSHKGNVVDITLKSMSISCEFDSALRSFLGRASLGDVSFFNENAMLLRRKAHEETDSGLNSDLGRVISNSQACGSFFCFEAQTLSQTGLLSGKVSLFLAPVQINARLEKMSPLLHFLRTLSLLLDSCRTTSAERSPDSTTTLAATTEVSVVGELLEIILPSSSEDRNDVWGTEAVVLSIRNIALQTPLRRRTSATAHVPSSLNFVEGSMSVSLCVCSIPKVGYMMLNSAFPGTHSGRSLVEDYRIQVAFADPPHLELSLGELALEVDEVDLRSVINVIKELRGEISSVSAGAWIDDGPLAGKSVAYQEHWSYTASQSPKPFFTIKLAGLLFSIVQGPGPPTALLTISLKRFIVGNLHPDSPLADSSFFMRADEVKLDEPSHNGSVFISRVSMNYGIEVKVDVGVFADIDTFAAEAGPASIEFLICKFMDIVQFGGLPSTASLEKQSKSEKIQGAPSGDNRAFRIQARCAKVGVRVSAADVLLAGSDLGINISEEAWSCLMNVTCLRDRTSKAGIHSLIGLPRVSGVDAAKITPRLRIEHHVGKEAKIRFQDLQLCIFPHVIRDVRAVIDSFGSVLDTVATRGQVEVIQEDLTDSRTSTEQGNAVEERSSCDNANQIVTFVHGEDFIVILPGSSSNGRAIGVICSSGKITSRESDMLIELRKSSLASAVDAVGAKDTDWSVVLPNADIDISYSKKTTSDDKQDLQDPHFNVPFTHRLRSKWSVSLLNDVSLLLTKLQLDTIKSSLWNNILSQDFAGTQQSGDEKAGWDQSLAGVAAVPKSMRTAFQVTTRHVLIELLNEESDSTGWIPDGLASFSMGPMSYSRDRLEHFSHDSNTTVIERSILTVTSLCIYDTRRCVSEPYRLVVDIHSPNKSMPAIKILSLMRIDPSCPPATQAQVMILHPWILIRPILFGRVMEFFNSTDGPGLSQEGLAQEMGREPLGEQTASDAVAAKVSVTVKLPQMFITEREPQCLSRALRIVVCDPGGSASLLFGVGRSLKVHSHVKLRGVVVSLCPPASDRSDNWGKVTTLVCGDKVRRKRTVGARDSLDAASKIAYLRRWATSSSAAELSEGLVSLPLVTVRLWPQLAVFSSATHVRVGPAALEDLCAFLPKLDLTLPEGDSSRNARVVSLNVLLNEVKITFGPLRCSLKFEVNNASDVRKYRGAVLLTLDARAKSKSRWERIISRCDLVFIWSPQRVESGLNYRSELEIEVDKCNLAVSSSTVSALIEVLPAVRRLERSSIPGSNHTGGKTKVLPVDPVQSTLPEIVRVGISDAIVSAVDSKPIREILRLSIKDIEFNFEQVGTQRRACFEVGRFFIEDLMAYRRSASERNDGEAPFGVIIAADGLQNPAERVIEHDLPVPEDGTRNRPPRETSVSGLRAAFYWRSPFEGVEVKVHLSPVDLRLDSRSIPCFVRYWAGITTSFSEIPANGDQKCSSLSQPVSRKTIRSLTVEPFGLHLGLHAPTDKTGTSLPLASASGVILKKLLQRALEWFFGREEALGFRLEIPPVSLRDVESSALLRRLVDEYRGFCFSFSLLKQVLLQPHSAIQLGGVGLLTYSRAPSVLTAPRGLLGLLEDKSVEGGTENQGVSIDDGDEVEPDSASESGSCGSSVDTTLDLTRSLKIDMGLASLTSVNVYERLGEGVRVLRTLRLLGWDDIRQDQYIFYTVIGEDLGLLITNARLLKIERPSKQVLKGVFLKSIRKCVAQDEVLVIHYKESTREPLRTVGMQDRELPWGTTFRQAPWEGPLTLHVGCSSADMAQWLARFIGTLC